MLMESARQEVVFFGLSLYEDGLTEGTSGNLSVYDPAEGLMAISPSGIPYEETRTEDVVVMDLAGRIVDGEAKPSSEHGLHRAIYRARPELCGIVHAHAMYCTTLACLGEPLRAVHYAIADAGAATLPLVPYHTFGTEALAKDTARALGDTARGLLMANHGMIACGDDLASAYSLARTMEWCAELQWRCMAAGEPNYLSDAQMEDAVARFSTYGQQDGSRTSY